MTRFMTCAASVVCALVYIVTMETMAVPQGGCCYSQQYEGKMYITVANFDQEKNSASLTHTEATMYLDHAKQLVAMDAISTTDPGGVVKSYTLIEDFNKQQGWYIQGKSCYKVPLSSDFPDPCIPDGSTLMGQFRAALDEAVQTWVLPNTDNSALRRITVSVNGCVPLQTTKVSFGKKSTMSTTLFGNLTKGISDPSVFVVPSFCH